MFETACSLQGGPGEWTGGMLSLSLKQRPSNFMNDRSLCLCLSLCPSVYLSVFLSICLSILLSFLTLLSFPVLANFPKGNPYTTKQRPQAVRKDTQRGARLT